MSELNVAVVDRSRTLYQGAATQVAIPSAEGDMGILPGHQPVLVVLRAGKVRITTPEGQLKELEVESGFASVDNNSVTVVSERHMPGRPLLDADAPTDSETADRETVPNAQARGTADSPAAH